MLDNAFFSHRFKDATSELTVIAAGVIIIPTEVIYMKINQVRLGCRTNTDIETDPQEYSLFVFRTAAMVSADGSDRRVPAGYAVIFTSKQTARISPAENGSLSYEMIGYKPSNSDLQYAASLNVRYNTPVQITDRVLVFNTLRSIKSRTGSDEKHTCELMELSLKILLLTLFAEHFEEKPPQPVQLPKLAQLKELRSRIYAEPAGDWDIDKICRGLRISRTYFHRLYHTAFGVTCRQDLIESRLLHAADLLAHSDLSIHAISDACGYDNESYFMRQFRQHRGCTPTEFRRRCSEGEDAGTQG